MTPGPDDTPGDEAAKAAGRTQEKPASVPAEKPQPPAPTAPVADEQPDGYTVDELAAQARNFFGSGTSPHAVVGAMHGLEGERFSIDTAKRALKSFLSREV